MNALYVGIHVSIQSPVTYTYFQILIKEIEGPRKPSVSQEKIMFEIKVALVLNLTSVFYSLMKL